MKKNHEFLRILFLIPVLLVFVLSACATQSLEPPASLPGFWKGLLHGFIIFFSFIGSLFTEWRIYSFPNNGTWYDLGFMIGASIFFSSGGGAAYHSSRKKKCDKD